MKCYTSHALKFAIAVDLKKKISIKDIPPRYFVSIKTVERIILHIFIEESCKKPYSLPKHLLIDGLTFKRARDCKDNFLFKGDI